MHTPTQPTVVWKSLIHQTNDECRSFLFQFIVAALALVAVADRPQPSYRPRPAYAAPTYAPAPAYKPQPKYAPAPAYKPIAILEQEDVHPGDGTYSSKFSTENGIYRSVPFRFPPQES